MELKLNYRDYQSSLKQLYIVDCERVELIKNIESGALSAQNNDPFNSNGNARKNIIIRGLVSIKLKSNKLKKILSIRNIKEQIGTLKKDEILNVDDEELPRLLVEKRINSITVNCYGNKPLHGIMKTINSISDLKVIANSFHPNSINHINSSKETPILVFLKNNVKSQVTVMAFLELIKLEPNVQVYDQNENSTLHWAIMSEKIELVKILLVCGAKPFVVGSSYDEIFKKNPVYLIEIKSLFARIEQIQVVLNEHKLEKYYQMLIIEEVFQESSLSRLLNIVDSILLDDEFENKEEIEFTNYKTIHRSTTSINVTSGNTTIKSPILQNSKSVDINLSSLNIDEDVSTKSDREKFKEICLPVQQDVNIYFKNLDKFILDKSISTKNLEFLKHVLQIPSCNMKVLVDDLNDGGGNSTVKKGYYNGIKVAIKIFKDDDDLINVYKELASNVILRNSKTVVKFYGVTRIFLPTETSGKEYLAMVMEQCKTSLYTELKTTDFRWQHFFKTYREVLECVRNLQKFTMVHRDLKSPNFMIDNNGKTKIGDFGTCRRNTESNIGTFIFAKGTSQYSAPESYIGTTLLESDIYSTGVVLWEGLMTVMCGGYRQPFVENINSDSPAQVNANPILCHRQVSHGFRLTMPDSTPLELKRLIDDMWSQTPSKRPPINQVVDRFISIYKNYLSNPSFLDSLVGTERNFIPSTAQLDFSIPDQFNNNINQTNDL